MIRAQSDDVKKKAKINIIQTGPYNPNISHGVKEIGLVLSSSPHCALQENGSSLSFAMDQETRRDETTLGLVTWL